MTKAALIKALQDDPSPDDTPICGNCEFAFQINRIEHRFFYDEFSNKWNEEIIDKGCIFLIN